MVVVVVVLVQSGQTDEEPVAVLVRVEVGLTVLNFELEVLVVPDQFQLVEEVLEVVYGPLQVDDEVLEVV